MWYCCTDYSKGFGGKYGVQKENMDSSALGYDHQEKLEKHESQKGIWQCSPHKIFVALIFAPNNVVKN